MPEGEAGNYVKKPMSVSSSCSSWDVASNACLGFCLGIEGNRQLSLGVGVRLRPSGLGRDSLRARSPSRSSRLGEARVSEGWWTRTVPVGTGSINGSVGWRLFAERRDLADAQSTRGARRSGSSAAILWEVRGPIGEQESRPSSAGGNPRHRHGASSTPPKAPACKGRRWIRARSGSRTQARASDRDHTSSQRVVERQYLRTASESWRLHADRGVGAQRSPSRSHRRAGRATVRRR